MFISSTSEWSALFNSATLEHGLGQLEVVFLSGELIVDAGEGVSLVLDVGLLGLVQVDLEQTRAVQANPESIAGERTSLTYPRVFPGKLTRRYLILLPTISAG